MGNSDEPGHRQVEDAEDVGLADAQMKVYNAAGGMSPRLYSGAATVCSLIRNDKTALLPPISHLSGTVAHVCPRSINHRLACYSPHIELDSGLDGRLTRRVIPGGVTIRADDRR